MRIHLLRGSAAVCGGLIFFGVICTKIAAFERACRRVNVSRARENAWPRVALADATSSLDRPTFQHRRAARRALPLRQARRICGGRGGHRDPACPRILARSMIAAEYRLFSAQPKASKLPRYAHTVRHFDLGRHAMSPGWSAILTLPDYGRVARHPGVVGRCPSPAHERESS